MVRSLTANDIMSVASKYFGDNNYCLAKIEPKQGSEVAK
jgi:predicted Zn-dependent peptidase